MEQKKKHKFTMPDTYVIITALLVITVILTWIVPAGTYDFEANGKTVIAGTYHQVDRSPAGIVDFLNSFFKGMQKGATTIFSVFLIGGAFGVLSATGCIEAALAALIRKTKGNYKIIISLVMLMMSVLGALGTGNNVSLAFVPIMLILCSKMSLDAVVAAACMYFASNSGFSGSPMNPFTVLLGQTISGLPSMSGLGARIIMWAVFTAIAILWTLRYCKKILENPQLSLTGVLENTNTDEESALDKVARKMNTSHVLCLIAMILTFVVFAIGGVKKNWDLAELCMCVMAMTFVIAILARMNPNRVAKAFVDGAKVNVYATLMIGFASGITVLMTNANIIHTLVYWLSLPLSKLPSFLAAIGMFVANFFINFPINSGSGQCYVVMPLMAPLADVLGVTRQVAISAFQFGDGLCNCVTPTAGLMMGTLGIAGVPYNKWLKFVFPAVMIQAAAAAVFLITVSLIGWA